MRPREILLCCGAVLLGGCTAWNPLGRSKKADEADESRIRLVSDLALPYGLHPVQVEAVGLVTGLHGTGSDPEPSAERAMLMEEMQRRHIARPNAVLASRNCSAVTIRAVLRPGIQKGDRFDLEVHVPRRSKTTSLRGGYLLEARLREMKVFSDGVHNGRDWGLAQGPVLVDPSADPKKDAVALGRGLILGGGVALRSRNLGLVLKPDHQSVMDSARVESAVNRRFHVNQRGIQTPVAKADNDKYIELTVHPRYKDNIGRYVQVVGALALSESSGELSRRLADLDERLNEPSTAAQAALELEAIGTPGIEVLLKGIQSKDQEVRFYAAEALAYLDRREAAEPLGEAARNVPAFRQLALTALSGLSDEFSAYEQLRDMLALPSAETRYGAFRALCVMNPHDALVKGEQLGGQFSYHVLDTPGQPMIHVTRSRRAEVVLFGRQQRLLTPLALSAGNQIMITSSGGDQVTVAKFTVNEADQKRTVSTSVDEVIRTIVELGGTYPDVVQALQEAKVSGALVSRFEVDSVPEAGRAYQPAAEGGGEGQQAGKSSENGKTDGSDKNGKKVGDDPATDEPAGDAADSAKKPRPARGFFAKIMGRDSE